MNWIFYIILLALVLSFALHALADKLNLKALSGPMPEAYAHVYSKRRYALFCAYETAQARLARLDAGVKLAVLLIFWLSGGFNWLNNLVLDLNLGLIASGLIFGAVILWAAFIIEIPFNYYHTFSIEQKYGFNRTTKKTFVLDRLKVFILISLLGAVIFSILIWFFARHYPLSWLWCWMALCLVMLCIQWLVPNIVMPLFNKFTFLPDGDLRNLIFDYARKLRFSIKDVYVMDGSKRSSKLNAFVSGLGGRRRVVLYDTLLEQCDKDEVLVVLAHEIGHIKCHHLRNGLIEQFLYMGVLLFLFSFFVNGRGLYDAFFMDLQTIYAGIIFFGLLYTPIDFFSAIILNYFSRKKEFQADRFAYNSTGDARSLIKVFEKLAVLNMANLKPHRFYVILNGTHPPLLMRIAAMEKLVKARGEQPVQNN